MTRKVQVGEHVTVDIVGTTQEYDIAFYENIVHKIADAAEVQVLNISSHKFEPQGSTTLALLAESHISFHTFPEHGIISFDFFTCGKVHPRVAIDILKKEIKHTKLVRKEFNRDTGNEMEFMYPSMNSSALIIVMVAILAIKRIFYNYSKVSAK